MHFKNCENRAKMGGLSSKFGATPSHGAGATRRADGRGTAIHISRERLGSTVAIGAGVGAHRGQRGARAMMTCTCTLQRYMNLMCLGT